MYDRRTTDQMREAADRLREKRDPIYDATATMLEREAYTRDNQPRGFYEVPEADLITSVALGLTA